MSELIEAYAGHLRAAGYSRAATIQDRRYILRKADVELPNGLRGRMIVELETWLSQWTQQWTLYTYFSHLCGFYAWACRGRQPRLDWNPMLELTRPRMPRSEPRPATEAQLAIALGLPAPWRTAVLLAAANGLRAGEIARLSREDITADWISVLRKGGKTQQLPTHAAVWAAVADLPAGPVIPQVARGGHHTPAWLSVTMSERLTAVGLPDLTLHWFRHRFATQTLLPVDLGGAGADIRTVQELLGHASVVSTQIYTRVVDRQRRAAIAGLTLPAVP